VLSAGIVFDPLRDELFWAERGEGAWVNQRRLRCSKRERLADCLIAHGRARSEEPGDQERLLAQMGYVMRHTRDLRRMGSAALDLCYVGAGRYDGFWEEGLKPWDIAAGIIIAQEAGVYITDTSGGPVSVKTGSVLAGNPNIHSQLHKALAGR
jgi:myo-inositol-1(or 4)-monophosphatase